MNTHEPAGRRTSLLRTAKAVAWSFVGIRKSSEFHEDMGKINPLHIIIVALLGVALFVGALLLLVHWVAGR